MCRVVLESYKRATARRRVNRGSVALFEYRRRQFVVELSCGNSDDVTVWRVGTTLYAVSVNRRYGYAGVEIFDISAAEEDDIFPRKLNVPCVGSVFMQGDEQAQEILGNGPRGGYGPFDYTPRTIASRVRDYLENCQ